MSRWLDFADSYELMHGQKLDDTRHKYLLSLDRAKVLFIKSLTSVDGRSLKWHVNKALEMYIQSLENEK